jgi:hypothetical protein
MNIGGDLLRRYGPNRPSRREPSLRSGGGDPGPGWPAAGFTLLGGLAALVVGTMVAWESEALARAFVPAAVIAVSVAALVHLVRSWHAGAAIPFRMRPATPMGFALWILVAATFVCWQLLAHRWGWPMAFIHHRRRRWWQMLGGP